MPIQEHDNPIWVSMLGAMIYCERLFYLEHVEGIEVADEAVLDGRTVHDAITVEELIHDQRLESAALGLVGKVDLLKQKNGRIIPWEFKKGRAKRSRRGAEPWPNERIQIGAYVLLITEALGESVREGRIHYLEDNVTVRVEVDEVLQHDVLEAVARARILMATTKRPPVTDDERKCWKCSLAKVCLPEEERAAVEGTAEPVRLFPAGYEQITLHVQSPGARIGMSGEQLTIKLADGTEQMRPSIEIGSVVLHGPVQISTQAIQRCVEKGIGIHWLTGSGRYVTGALPAFSVAHRRRTQYSALLDKTLCLDLARRLVMGKLAQQLGYLMRCRREHRQQLGEEAVRTAIERIRVGIKEISSTEGMDTLRGIEGMVARAYFAGIEAVIASGVPHSLRPHGRSKRPPRDPFNCLLSFGYSMLYKDVISAISVVGLDPVCGFFHQPR
ncbi:MAG: CRISPR-associated endonuclease Cas1, partial [Cyanobacteria bacterium NC_groundwater_1444_Ag_S-0.65um_54_12]|nr:CRISPR-associated endonuclease Cas1 [Cyanobacteria bacterium NC_groundwater_1444_Ag_S-0.65um_54_12]